MNLRRGTVVIWAVIAAAFLAVVYGLLVPSGPRFRDTPFMREYTRIHKICTALRFYAEDHTNSAVSDFSGRSIDDLAVAGILSQDDATYIREHRIEFLDSIQTGLPVTFLYFSRCSPTAPHAAA